MGYKNRIAGFSPCHVAPRAQIRKTGDWTCFYVEQSWAMYPHLEQRSHVDVAGKFAPQDQSDQVSVLSKPFRRRLCTGCCRRVYWIRGWEEEEEGANQRSPGCFCPQEHHMQHVSNNMPVAESYSGILRASVETFRYKLTLNSHPVFDYPRCSRKAKQRSSADLSIDSHRDPS